MIVVITVTVLNHCRSKPRGQTAFSLQATFTVNSVIFLAVVIRMSDKPEPGEEQPELGEFYTDYAVKNITQGQIKKANRCES